MKPNNGLTKCPLPLLLISNGRYGGVVGLGHARIIGNARCSAPVTEKIICNGPETTRVTNNPSRPEPNHATTTPVTDK